MQIEEHLGASFDQFVSEVTVIMLFWLSEKEP